LSSRLRIVAAKAALAHARLIGRRHDFGTAAAGLTPAPSVFVKPPRVAECPVNLECKHYQTLALPSATRGLFNSVVIGRVVGVHIADSVIGADGKVDIASTRPLARLRYPDYTSVTEIFEMRPAGTSEATIRG
jgi:flavin reductase (DIM6/NTAB) family NADH-FMN oxidoreductase RutF